MHQALGRSLLRRTMLIPALALALAAAPLSVSAGVPVAASVTITLATDPAVDPQDFSFTNSFLVSSQTFNVLDTDPVSSPPLVSYAFAVADVDLGSVYVTETEPSGWTLTDIQCTGDTDVSYNVNGNNVSLDVDAGENIACTFSNTKFAQLTLQKVTVPASDPQDFDFDLTGTGVPADYDLDTDPGSMFTGSNITFPMQPDDLGEYSITESEVSGWTLIEIDCTGNTDGDRLTSIVDRVVEIGVDAGELITCTFTNVKDGFESQIPSQVPSGEPSTDPSTEPSTDPSTEPSTEPSSDSSTAPSADSSSDQEGSTDQASAPGTDTSAPASTAPAAGSVLLLVAALVALSLVLLLTRPRRKRA